MQCFCGVHSTEKGMCAAWPYHWNRIKAWGQAERLERRGLIFSNRKGSTEFEHDAEIKDSKPAEERGAKKPERREQGQCYGNQMSASKHICDGTMVGGVAAGEW